MAFKKAFVDCDTPKDFKRKARKEKLNVVSRTNHDGIEANGRFIPLGSRGHENKPIHPKTKKSILAGLIAAGISVTAVIALMIHVASITPV